ncbi:asparagine synthase (glutamine-hydrolyzing) [Desulfomicrobium macestii]|uniref:asparagine synthase (glutamine-hydrolyzing) n=1 Tax=Desulfomicrobium macestii TaxID=90731 RepID=A0ABR9H6T0_9BACT|nr:asparagine synthase (glutamine-hydrolyzing) [Desulfomicrobium macestii]MBE1426395.1 asparagine synthase (glutamine-hydrolyzing) [Desulfomicrobium macestii]
MCGIAAIISRTGRPVNPMALKAMNDSLAHRGPDDSGYAFLNSSPAGNGKGGSYAVFTDPAFRHRNQHIAPFGGDLFASQFGRMGYTVGMAHRRLSIIDLAPTGHQPMPTMNNRFWIVYNGEIYNHIELRNDLESNGRVFQGTSDTEVLLQLWEEYGEACIPMLNGMFAALVVDLATGGATLFRDRHGIKPVYYAVTDDYLLLASEPKGILHSCLLDATIDHVAMCEYFTFQNIYSDRTLFQGIQLLEPGHTLSLDVGSGEEPAIRRYHDRSATAVDLSGDSFKSVCERVADAFERCIRRQLVSDVEVGAYLSGGMDSGSIVAASCAHIPRMHTFTCGFDLSNVFGIEQGFDERKESEALSHLLQTEHYEVVLHSGDMQAALERITWHVDDLRVGMCHQNWYAAKLASKFVKVCLSGTGGDELFAGYPWRYEKCFQWQGEKRFEDAYFSYWHRLLPPNELGSLFAPGMGDLLYSARESFQSALERAKSGTPNRRSNEELFQQILNFEFDTFLHGLLTIEDKISMAHGMEVRVPFLDNELVDLAAGIPAEYNLKMNENRAERGEFPFLTTDGKLILRCAMERYLPNTYTLKPKQGFSPPDENWYRGPTMEYIRSILLDRQTTSRPWFDAAVVEEKLQDHFHGWHNRRLLIWSLLVFEWLQRHYVDRTYSL